MTLVITQASNNMTKENFKKILENLLKDNKSLESSKINVINGLLGSI